VFRYTKETIEKLIFSTVPIFLHHKIFRIIMFSTNSSLHTSKHNHLCTITRLFRSFNVNLVVMRSRKLLNQPLITVFDTQKNLIFNSDVSGKTLENMLVFVYFDYRKSTIKRNNRTFEIKTNTWIEQYRFYLKPSFSHADSA